MKRFGLVAFLFSLAGFCRAEEPLPLSYPVHSVPGTVVRVLPRTRDDRLYQIHIAVPSSYKPGSATKYPVVLVTDAYYDFTTVLAAYGNSHYGKQLPEMLIVGLGYAGADADYEALRQNDLAPVDLDPKRTGQSLVPGRAKEFLELIKTSVLPMLEKDYNADPQHRFLMGCSMGGLFTLYTMYTEPDLFQGYVADSPAVESLWPFEADFAASGKTVKAPVYIAEAQNEWPGFRAGILSFVKLLQTRDYLKGGFRFKEVADLRHAGGKPETYSHGMVFVCQSIAPESGPSKDWFYDAKGRNSYVLVFRPAANSMAGEMPEAHVQFLKTLATNPDIVVVQHSTKNEPRPFTIISGFFDSPEAVKQFVDSDPSVAKGLTVVTIR